MKQKILIISSILLVLMLIFSTAITGCGEEEPVPAPAPAPAPEPAPAPAPAPEPEQASAPAPEPEPEPAPAPEPEPEPEWQPPGPVVQPDTATINWDEAVNHIGATTTVCGKVKDVSAVKMPNLVLLVGGALGKGIGIEVLDGAIAGDLREMYIGEIICVSGLITDQLLGGPMILVTDPSQIEVQEPEPAPEPGAVTGPAVYVSVSVDGELIVVAQPVAVTTDMTLDDALKAAHEAYYSDGESGYTAGIDPSFGIYLITQCWGVMQTPFIILNDSPAPGPIVTTFVDATPVVANDNIIICTSNVQGEATPVSLAATLSDGSATVTATSWIFNIATFTYTSEPLADANVIDPATGASLGTTDADGNITVTVPESGVVAIEGLAALMVAPPETAAEPAAAAEVSWEEGVDYIGEEVTLCGPIIDAFPIDDNTTLLGMGASCFDPSAVGIEVSAAILGDLPEDLYVGQEICVSGTPHTNPNGGASIAVSDPSQISVKE